MNRRWLWWPLLLLLASSRASAQTPVGSAFTYQGKLADGGVPANGPFDFQLALYDASVAGTQVGPLVLLDDVQVNDGLFTATLDFGTVFGTDRRWLEVRVRPGSSTASFTVLDPRQELTPSPGALYASAATHATTAVNFTGSLGGEVAGPQSGTIVANGVSANTASTIVRRDGTGSFSAGTVTLEGNLDLPSSSSAATGMLTKGGIRFLHSSGGNNTFVGLASGSTSLAGSQNTAVGRSALARNLESV